MTITITHDRCTCCGVTRDEVPDITLFEGDYEALCEPCLVEAAMPEIV